MYLYENKKKNNVWKNIGLIFVTVIVTVFVMQYVPDMFAQNENSKVQRLSNEQSVKLNQTEIKDDENDIINIVENNMKSVVGISVLQPDEKSLLDVNVTQKWGIGTGIILSDNGYILTNQHLAKNKNSKVTVTLDDGDAVQGKVIWVEKNLDLAIIKIEKENLTPASLGDSSNIKIGESVIAIGNPLGLEFQRSVTSGIVSGLNRSIMFEENGNNIFMEDLIQTDASINSGNSGGPLINSNGDVIGINTVKITTAEGIGFALPINVIKPILEKLETSGTFQEGYLGIYAHDKEVVPYINSQVQLDRGIYVVSVDENGPSGKAGIKVGDIIISIDQNDVDKMIELREYIYSKSPNTKVTLKIIRDDKQIDIVVTLGKKT